MKVLSLVMLFVLVSCGSGSDKSKESANQAMISSKSFLLECNKLESSLFSDSECNKIGITNQKIFLFNFDYSNNQNIYEDGVENFVNLKINLGEDVIEGRFILISKYGKVLSNEAVYNQNEGKLSFFELEEGNFLSHEVYLQTKSLILTNGENIKYDLGKSLKCVTGKVNFEEFQNLVQPDGCENLRMEKVYTGALVQKAEFYEAEETRLVTRVMKNGVISKPKKGQEFVSISVLSKYEVKLFNHFSKEVKEFSEVYEIDEESGTLFIKKEKQCLTTGILKYTDREVRTGKWFVVADEIVMKAASGSIEVQGTILDAKEDYKRNECFDLNPQPIGYMLIKE
ncbi:hypothetical protein ABMA70_12650 [Halobacteriovorax sp. XZX-3]|uniref:hypothetical protein n=1 Tax=unclassified Halobacteriovorax TaxID=2639665 RepID=UPI0037104C44